TAGISGAGRGSAGAHQGGRWFIDRDARVQLFDPWRVEERDRLGLAPAGAAIRRQADRPYGCKRRRPGCREGAVSSAAMLRLPERPGNEQSRGDDPASTEQV